MDGKRSDAIWHSRACAVRWARAHPGKSLYAVHSANKGRTKPAGRKASYQKTLRKLRSRFGMVPRSFLLTRDQALSIAEDALREALPGEKPSVFVPVRVIPIHARNKKTRNEREAA